MIPIVKSQLQRYFIDVKDQDGLLDSILLLEKDEAVESWQHYFGLNVKGFHRFPIESWVAGPWKVIGDWWSESEGLSNLAEVSETIAGIAGWMPGEPLLFVQSQSSAIYCSFEAFSHFWQELLDVYDDGPFLISRNQSCSTVFCFTVLGQILVGSYSHLIAPPASG